MFFLYLNINYVNKYGKNTLIFIIGFHTINNLKLIHRNKMPKDKTEYNSIEDWLKNHKDIAFREHGNKNVGVIKFPFPTREQLFKLEKIYGKYITFGNWSPLNSNPEYTWRNAWVMLSSKKQPHGNRKIGIITSLGSYGMDQLKKDARKLRIKGISQMNKQELYDAVDGKLLNYDTDEELKVQAKIDEEQKEKQQIIEAKVEKLLHLFPETTSKLSSRRTQQRTTLLDALLEFKLEVQEGEEKQSILHLLQSYYELKKVWYFLSCVFQAKFPSWSKFFSLMTCFEDEYENEYGIAVENLRVNFLVSKSIIQSDVARLIPHCLKPINFKGSVTKTILKEQAERFLQIYQQQQQNTN